MTALELQSQLRLLHCECYLAALTGVVNAPGYAADLEDEIDTVTKSYLEAAVTEMAMLRAEMFGPQFG